MKIEEILKKVNSDIEHAETLLKRGEKILDAIDVLQSVDNCVDNRIRCDKCHNFFEEHHIIHNHEGKKYHTGCMSADMPKNGAISDASSEHVESDNMSAEGWEERFDEEYYGEINKLSDSELWKFCRSEKVGGLFRHCIAQARAEERHRIIDMIYQHPFQVSKVATSIKELIASIQAMV